ncbi:tetratricopeptide repeat protein [Psychrobacter sp.]|uniref:tetratricopeptide repeat protein n=1 Tax=Psychrobacter sp. TaxID=56811 RepID=UPI003F9A4EB1
MGRTKQLVLSKLLFVVLSGSISVTAGATTFIPIPLVANKVITTGQATLGYMYRNGDGAPQDDVQAFRWTKRAAKGGHALSQYRLAEMYSSGTGVSRDPAKSVEWYDKAASQGDTKI